MAEGTRGGNRLSVFISYSRDDLRFADQQGSRAAPGVADGHQISALKDERRLDDHETGGGPAVGHEGLAGDED